MQATELLSRTVIEIPASLLTLASKRVAVEDKSHLQAACQRLSQTKVE